MLVAVERDVSDRLGITILIVGIAASTIHIGHCFNLRITPLDTWRPHILP
jgi:hypothetical protein